MIKEALEYLVDLRRPDKITIDGKPYATGKLQAIRPPEVQPIKVHTLDGILDVLQMQETKEGEKFNYFINVCDPTRVNIQSCEQDEWEGLDVLCECNLFEREVFPFGRYLEIEEFVIKLQCLFEDTPSKAKIIQYIGNIRDESVSTSIDNGISQEVIIENRVGRMDKVTITPIIELSPYRTFVEARQPCNKFLLRVKHNKESLPQVALFETDSGAWKVQAVKNVALFFKEIKFIKERKIIVLA
jgi:hypothetical protein